MSKIAIVFGSSNGGAKELATYINSLVSGEILDVKELSSEFLDKFDSYIFVSSTLGKGELQPDFKKKLGILEKYDFAGKKVALAGVGGLARHSDTFCNGLIYIYSSLYGIELVGSTKNDYTIKYSKSLVNGKFIGLCLDLKEDANWKEKASSWVAGLGL